jgi:hypothetical protein
MSLVNLLVYFNAEYVIFQYKQQFKMETKMDKQAVIEIATSVKDNWVRNYLSYDKKEGLSHSVITDTADITILQDDYSKNKVVFRRPRLEKLNPSKGILLFLKAIYNTPGLKSWKHYLFLTNNKLTSFNTLRSDLVNWYCFITDKYQVTELGKKLLTAYGLI